VRVIAYATRTLITYGIRVMHYGAGLRLNGLNIAPSDFGISFDNFETMHRCRLIWRDGDFVGAAFET
jgi:hypothetical protein